MSINNSSNNNSNDDNSNHQTALIINPYNDEEIAPREPSCCETAKLHATQHIDLAKNHFTAFYVSNFGMSVGTSVFTSLIPITLRSLGESDATIGWIVALFGIGRFIAEIPITLLSLKFGPWIISLVSMVALTLTFTLPTIELTTWSFIVANSLGGLFIAGFATSRHEFLQVAFKKGERSRVSGHMGAIGRISYLIAPSSGGALMEHAGSTYAYCFGLFFLLITIGSVFSRELIDLDESLRRKHEEEVEKENKKAKRLKEQEKEGIINNYEAPLLFDDEQQQQHQQQQSKSQNISALPSSRSRRGEEDGMMMNQGISVEDISEIDQGNYYSNNNNNEKNGNDDDNQDEGETSRGSLSAMEADAQVSNSSFTLGNNPSTFPLRAASLYLTDKQRAASTQSSVKERNAPESSLSAANDNNAHSAKKVDEQHFSSPLAAFKVHWKTVFGIGFIVLSVMSIRQARRLTITLRAMNLGYNPRDVGFILSASFAVDTVFFWVSSTVVNKRGYVWALTPLCFFYGLAFLVESIEPASGSPVTLFLCLPMFGLGDSFGAGIILSLISEMVPRALVGVTRIALDLGVLVGPLFTGFLAHQFSLSKSCWALCAWSIVTGIAAIVMLRGGVGKQN